MAKQLDKVISDILKKHGFDHKAAWDCHGTWVVYHNVLEKIAAKEGIIFQQPFVCSSTPDNIAICVTGELQDRVEWSIGEAAPKNCKNAYYWAMAEKRAKDRVILKLIGLAGLVYSEEEAYDLKAEGKGVWEATKQHGPLNKGDLREATAILNSNIDNCETYADIMDVINESKDVRDQMRLDMPEDCDMDNQDGENTFQRLTRVRNEFKIAEGIK